MRNALIEGLKSFWPVDEVGTLKIEKHPCNYRTPETHDQFRATTGTITRHF